MMTAALRLYEGWEEQGRVRLLKSVNDLDHHLRIYFTGPFGTVGSILHSAVPPVALLLVYWLLKLGRRDRRRILLWFVLGWLGHTVADFLTHVDDVRPLFWPITDWTWSNSVSYYNSAYYGREFFAISHALIFLIMGTLLIRRLRRRRSEPGPTGKGL